MQSPPFGILRINNNNSHHTGNPPPKQGQQAGQLAPILVTNLPLGLADVEEREEQESKENKSKVPEAPRKAEPSQETAHTLLIAPMNLTRHFQPDPMMLMTMMMYLQTIHKLCKAKQKAMMRKRLLWQLLLQRSVMPATPTILVVVAPYYSQAFVTNYPKYLLRAQHCSSRSGYQGLPRRRTLGRVQDL